MGMGKVPPDVDAEDGEEGATAPKAKSSGIGRILNGGQPLACGHCTGQATGVDGELKGVDVSPQGVSENRPQIYSNRLAQILMTSKATWIIVSLRDNTARQRQKQTQ